MRKLFADLFLIAAAMISLASCTRQGHDEGNILTGEWKLEEVGGIPASDLIQDGYGGLDIYLVFSKDLSFEIFQRLEGGDKYVRHTGSYTFDGTVAAGSYSDGAPWGTDYRINVNGDILTMTGNSEDYVYVRTSVPEAVRSSAIDSPEFKSSSVSDNRFL